MYPEREFDKCLLIAKDVCCMHCESNVSQSECKHFARLN